MAQQPSLGQPLTRSLALARDAAAAPPISPESARTIVVACEDAVLAAAGVLFDGPSGGWRLACGSIYYRRADAVNFAVYKLGGYSGELRYTTPPDSVVGSCRACGREIFASQVTACVPNCEPAGASAEGQVNTLDTASAEPSTPLDSE